MNISVTIDNIPIEKMTSGFFDELVELKTESRGYFLHGKIKGFKGVFNSVNYPESLDLEKIKGLGLMNEEGKLLI